jgi:two-component system response regulator AgrA
MINIIICEDESMQRKNLEGIIKEILEQHNHEINIGLSTPIPEAVIEYVNMKKDEMNIYFLDIDLKSSIDGLALAEKIREVDVKGFIVFITSFTDMAHKTFEYKLEAMDYIVKDLNGNINDRIEACIKKAIKSYNMLTENHDANCKSFYINTLEKDIKIKHKDIMFFETTKALRKLRVHMSNGQIEFAGYINELEKELNENFYRCHRGFLVNVNNIIAVDKENFVLHMINGETCFYSRRLTKGVLDKWRT